MHGKPVFFIQLFPCYPGKCLVHTSLHIRRMQQMMCLLASRLAQVGCIQFLDRRVLMRFTDRVILIQIVKHFCPQCTDIFGISYMPWLLRLSAAVDTSARSSHNLNKMIVGFPVLHHI